MLESPVESGIFEAQSLEKPANPGHWLHVSGLAPALQRVVAQHPRRRQQTLKILAGSSF
jgi:hypothetical protein